MARDKDYWDRWEHFQKHGYWPPNKNVNKQQFTKKQNAAEDWERKNPEMAAYDSNGRPWGHSDD